MTATTSVRLGLRLGLSAEGGAGLSSLRIETIETTVATRNVKFNTESYLTVTKR